MYKSLKLFRFYLFLICCCGALMANAQQRPLSGQVYAPPMVSYPLGNIMVESKSGSTTYTDEKGRFVINVVDGDSLYFILDGIGPTQYYTLDTVPAKASFRIAYSTIESSADAIATAKAEAYKKLLGNDAMEQVIVRSRNFHKDSLENRAEYDKYFRYRKPTVGQTAVGMLGSPVTAVYEFMNKKKQKRNMRMQRNLITSEEQGYVDTKFNAKIIRDFVGPDEEDSTIDAYMVAYRPSFYDAKSMNELDIASYILKTYKEFLAKRNANAAKNPTKP